LKDENGAILGALSSLLKWIAEGDASNQFRTVAQTRAKRRELETKVELPPAETKNEEDEGDEEGDDDAPAALPSDEDLD